MTMVRNGIDNIDQHLNLLEGKRVGLITAPTGLDKDLNSTIDILNERCNLVALFSPEHGVRGDIQAGLHVDTYVDEKTGITVYSLYGGDNRPAEAVLDKVDTVVMDVQDIGSRYYTFISTMNNVMESCAQQDKQFVLLDRVNPIGGIKVEGNILREEYKSFVGIQPIAPRHGMTMGEVANYFNEALGIHCDLAVVKVTGWTRDMTFEDTGLTWVLPSPNIPTVDTATIYNGTCLFEGTSLSEGRGTTKPFEIIGAPWVDPDALAKELNDKKLDGVIFRPLYFTPIYSKHKDELCKGVEVHITDSRAVNAMDVGVHMIYELKRQGGDNFQWLPPGKSGRQFIDLLCGSDELRTFGGEAEELLEQWRSQAESFRALRADYLLYR